MKFVLFLNEWRLFLLIWTRWIWAFLFIFMRSFIFFVIFVFMLFFLFVFIFFLWLFMLFFMITLGFLLVQIFTWISLIIFVWLLNIFLICQIWAIANNFISFPNRVDDCIVNCVCEVVCKAFFPIWIYGIFVIFVIPVVPVVIIMIFLIKSLIHRQVVWVCKNTQELFENVWSVDSFWAGEEVIEHLNTVHVVITVSVSFSLMLLKLVKNSVLSFFNSSSIFNFILKPTQQFCNFVWWSALEARSWDFSMNPINIVWMRSMTETLPQFIIII